MAVGGHVRCCRNVSAKQALEEQEDRGCTVTQEGLHHLSVSLPVFGDGNDGAHGKARGENKAVRPATHARVCSMSLVPSAQGVEGQSHVRDLALVESGLIEEGEVRVVDRLGDRAVLDADIIQDRGRIG